MMKLLVLFLAIVPFALRADTSGTRTNGIVEHHILGGYAALAKATDTLQNAADEQCSGVSANITAAYSAAFDRWVAVSHLRFGPSEVDNRAFAMGFWPDPRGSTQRSLVALIAAQDSAVHDPAQFAEVSIAARGLYALEFLLYDATFSPQQGPEYWCALVRAIAGDVHSNATAILNDWRSHYADQMNHPGAGGSSYRTPDETLQEMFKALSTGLQFTADTRLGRPLGTFDHPRPKRAEARRSDRSLRHVVVSLTTLRGLAMRLAGDNETIRASLDAGFERSLTLANQLGDPVFASVATPQGRFQVESLQQSVTDIREIVAYELGPMLGVASGFNALDGD